MIKIRLDLKPKSYNALYKNSRGGRKYLPEDSKLYLQELEYIFTEQKTELRNLRDSLIQDQEMLALEIYYYYSEFYTKKKTINKRCMDVDNPTKPIIDELFKVIGIDDYILGDLHNYKRPSENDCVILMLSKVPLHNKDYLDFSVNELLT